MKKNQETLAANTHLLIIALNWTTKKLIDDSEESG